MVGRLLSYWEGNFSGVILNFGRVVMSWWGQNMLVKWKNEPVLEGYCWWRKSCTSWYGETTHYLPWFYTSQMVSRISSINSINYWFSLMNHLKMLHLLLNMVIFQLAMLVFWLLTIKKYQESLNRALFPLKTVEPVEVSSCVIPSHEFPRGVRRRRSIRPRRQSWGWRGHQFAIEKRGDLGFQVCVSKETI